MYLKSALGINLGLEQRSKQPINKVLFTMQKSLWGIKQKQRDRSVFCGVLDSEIQPERSSPSPTESKETLDYMLREKIDKSDGPYEFMQSFMLNSIVGTAALHILANLPK